MNRTTLILIVYLQVSLNIFGQIIENGPVVGALTNTSVKFYIKTNTAGTVNFQINTADTFTGIAIQTVNTNSGINQNHKIFEIDDLSANTTYYYQFSGTNNSVLKDGKFKTAPNNGESGHYKFAFGACNKYILESGNWVDSIYSAIDNQQPDLFINLGDWYYPDFTDNIPTDNNFFSANPVSIEDSYAVRYGSTHFKAFAKKYPIAYVYDDHDYVNNNASKNTASYVDANVGNITIQEVSFPPNTRSNIIAGYHNFFPAYELPDTSNGIYQKINYGNIDFFLLDTRSNRSSVTEPLYKDSNNNWVFNPDSNHTILGETQMQWLKDELQNSTATWKVIGSGVVFNAGYQFYLDSLLALANSNPFLEPLAGLAASLVDSWVGYPKDQLELLNFVDENALSNVIFVSGDSHTGAIDNGENAGLPELMAASLSQDNSGLASEMANFGYNVWNMGGQGLGNSDTTNCFGIIESYADDSLELKLINAIGEEITKHTIYNCDLLQTSISATGTCANESNGTAEIALTFANEPAVYSSNGVDYFENNALENLNAGNNAIFVKDINGCVYTEDVFIDSFEGISSSIGECYTNSIADGAGTEFILQEVNGGQSPYSIVELNNFTFSDADLAGNLEINYNFDAVDDSIWNAIFDYASNYNNLQFITLTLVDANGCSVMQNFDYTALVHLIENENASTHISVDNGRISIRTNETIKKISIFTLNGQEVHSAKNVQGRYELELPKGIYFVKSEYNTKGYKINKILSY